MRPDDSIRRELRQGPSRARMLLAAGLDWLPGAPLATSTACEPLKWLTVPWEQPGAFRLVDVTRERLQRGEQTLTRLRHGFGRALPKVVEDPADWLTRMDYVFGLLKQAIHEGASLPLGAAVERSPLPHRWLSDCAALGRRHPSLRPLLDAVGWLRLTQAAPRAEDRLAWIAAVADGLASLAPHCDLERLLLLCIAGCELAPSSFQTLVSLFTCADLGEAVVPPADAWYALLHRLPVAGLDLTELQRTFATGPSVHDAAVRFLHRLVAEKPADRRTLGALLAAVMPRSLPRATRIAAAVSRSVAQHEGELREISSNERPAAVAGACRTWQRERDRYGSSVRRCVHLVAALETLPALLPERRLARALGRLLARLQGRWRPTALGMFLSWEEAGLFREPAKCADLLERLDQLGARQGIPPVLLDHWRSIVSSNRFFEWFDQTLDLPSARARAASVRLLGLACAPNRPPLEGDQLLWLIEYLWAAHDVDETSGGRVLEQATQLALATIGDQPESFRETIGAALALGDDVHGAAELLRALTACEELAETVTTLGKQLRDPVLRAACRAAALQGESAELKPLARKLTSLRLLRAPLPTLPPATPAGDWIRGYPPPLHEALHELARATPAAEQIAARLLRRRFPTDQSLAQELAAIDRLLAAGGDDDDSQRRERLRQRRRNLAARLGRPCSCSPARGARLAVQLRMRAQYELLRRFDLACQTAIETCIAARWGVDLGRVGLGGSPYEQLIAGILELQAGRRDLAWRIVEAQARNPSEDFREWQANAEFLQRLGELGLNLEPWLDHCRVAVARTAEGVEYRLGFARNPLDVLLMGWHFDTCLSPGAGNFFATLANAVDVNKQVLFGRTADGRVVGRCLFALSDDGRLLTYRRYAHREEDQFAGAVDRFAAELAEDMGARLFDHGEVSSLVAREWYDDGPIAGAGALQLRAADGGVRAAIAALPEGAGVADLARVLGGERWVVAALDALLGMPEVRQRADLVAALGAWMHQQGRVGFATRVRLAVAAQERQLVALARASALSEGLPRLLRELRRQYCCSDCDVFVGIGSGAEVYALTTALAPSLTLRLIRSTRTGRGGDSAEPASRRRALAEAHRRLGRERLAQRLASPNLD